MPTVVDSGVFTLGDLYPSMVDSTTGYPMILNAHTTPGSLDLAGTELKASLRNASQAFLSSMQSHLTHHLTLASGLAHSQTRLCGQDLLVFPSSEQLAADEEQASVTVAVTPIITYRWEGLVVRASQQVVPWRLLPAHDAKQGASVRLCPMGVEAVIKRTLTVNESGRSSPNRDQSLTSDAKDSFELDHPELVKGLSLNHWVIVSWEGQDVVWPLDLTIQLQPYADILPSM